ncbi:MAG TPA: hypothetical protein VF909_19265 [Roseiflexaceae bacterium]
MRPELHNTLPHMELTATPDGYRAHFIDWLTPATPPQNVAAADIAAFLCAFGGAVWSEDPTVLGLIAATGCTRFNRW